MLSEIIRESAGARVIAHTLPLLAVTILFCGFARNTFLARAAVKVGPVAKHNVQNKSSQLIQVKVAYQLPKLFHTFHGLEGLPGVPFKFPNGQGTEKFFNGRRAARKWRNQYGSMYSIWSGFKREM